MALPPKTPKARPVRYLRFFFFSHRHGLRRGDDGLNFRPRTVVRRVPPQVKHQLTCPSLRQYGKKILPTRIADHLEPQILKTILKHCGGFCNALGDLLSGRFFRDHEKKQSLIIRRPTSGLLRFRHTVGVDGFIAARCHIRGPHGLEGGKHRFGRDFQTPTAAVLRGNLNGTFRDETVGMQLNENILPLQQRHSERPSQLPKIVTLHLPRIRYDRKEKITRFLRVAGEFLFQLG